MAMVSNWADPLEKAILKLLSKPELSATEIDRIEKTAALLDGAPLSGRIQGKIELQRNALEQRYQTALQKASSDNPGTLQEAVAALEKLSGYKEADPKIKEARERIEQLRQEAEEREKRRRRRSRRIGWAAALVVIAVIAGLIIRQSNVDKQVRQRVREAQTLANHGENDEAVDRIAELLGEGRTGTRYPEIYMVTETVLENTVESEGFDAAFELKDKLRETLPDGVAEDTFVQYAKSRLHDDELSPAEKWALLGKLEEQGAYLLYDAEAVVEEYLATLPAEEVGGVALEALEKGWIKSKSDAFAAACRTAVEGMPAEDAWAFAVDTLKQVKLADDDGLLETAIARIAEEHAPGEVWAKVADAVEDGAIDAKSEQVLTALNGALDELPVEEAWEVARRASELQVLSKSDDTLRDAFVNYVNSLDIRESWPIIYAAYRDNTVSLSGKSVGDVYRRYVGYLDDDTSWGELQGYADDGMLEKLPADVVAQVAGKRMSLLTRDLQQGHRVDVRGWLGQQQPSLTSLAVDPESALQLVNALEKAGYDPVELFPDGILISLPVAEKVRALVNDLVNEKNPDHVPDMSAVLPVSIVENDRVSGIPIYEQSQTIEMLLNDAIMRRQTNDANYQVRLLPDALLRLPKSARPAQYSECKSLLCLQNVYLYAGSIYQSNSMPSILDSSLPSYRPFFSALDMVAVYELADGGASECLYVQQHPAQVADEAWFQENKHRALSLFTDRNMLGSFDNDALKAQWDDFLDTFELLRVYMLIDTTNPEVEDAANDAD